MRDTLMWMTSHFALAFDLAAGDDDHAMLGWLAILLEDARADDEVGDAGFILEGHEHDARGGARPLPHQHDASDGNVFALRPAAFILQFDRLMNPALLHSRAKERHRMRLERQTKGRVIIDHLARRRYRRERDVRWRHAGSDEGRPGSRMVIIRV
jgi:hypothetical protein